MFMAKKTKSDLTGSMVRFADGRRECTSRYKHLRLHLDQYCKEEEERRTFVEQHAQEVFQLFLDLLIQAEPVSYVSSNRVNLAELESALWLLEMVLQTLPELVSHRWQYSAIGSVLKRLLHPQSLIGLRRIGLRLFLFWYQCLSQGPLGAAELDAWFANLIPNFVGRDGSLSDTVLQDICENPGIRVLSLSVSGGDEQQLFSRKARSLPMVAELKRSASKALVTQSFMEKTLEFISSDCTKVQWHKDKREARQAACLNFLIDKVYQYYAAVCCPHMVNFDVTRIISSASLDPFCDPDASLASTDGNDPQEDSLQKICAHVIIRWIALYAFSYRRTYSSTTADDSMNDSEVSFVDTKQQSPASMAFSPTKGSDGGGRTPVNYAMVRMTLFRDKALYSRTYGLLREAFYLPLNYVGTLARVFRVLREWLLEDEENGLQNGASGAHRDDARDMKIAIAILVSFFDSSHLKCSLDDCEPKQRAVLVVQICIRILTLFKQVACTAGVARMNRETWHFMLKALLHVVHRSLPEVASSFSPYLTPVAPQMFQTLLVTWVFAGLNVSLPLQLWDELVDTLQRRTTWSALLLEWGKVMESITRALGLEVYGVDLLGPPLERSRFKKKPATIRQLYKQDAADKISADGDLKAASSQSMAVSLLLVSSSSGSSKRLSNCEHSMDSFTDPLTSAVSPSDDIRSADMAYPGHEKQSAEASVDHALDTAVTSEDSDSYDSASGQLSSADGSLTAGVKSMLLADDLLVESTIMATNDADTVSDEFTCCQDAEASPEQCISIPKSILYDQDVSHGFEAAPEPLGVVWRRILCCLGDVSRIEDPEIHVHAMEVIRLVLHLLIKIRTNQGASPALVPPTGLLVPWLSETLHLGRSHATSRVIAARLYCLIMAQRHEVPVAEVNLADFFLFASSLAIEDDDALVNAFLVSCWTAIFREFWPTCLLVLPELLSAASRIMRSISQSSLETVDRLHVVHFVSSVTLLPARRPTFPTYQEPSKAVENGSLQMQVFRCLLDSLGPSDCSSSIALRGLSLMLHSLLRDRKLNGIVEGCFETILKHMLHGWPNSLRQVICQLFNSLLVFSVDLSENHFRLLRHLFSVYSSVAQELVASHGSKGADDQWTESLLERICTDLVEWMLLIPDLVIGCFKAGQEPAPLLTVLRIFEELIGSRDQRSTVRCMGVGLYAMLNCCFDQATVCTSASHQEQQTFGVGLAKSGTLIGKVTTSRGVGKICSRTVVGQHVWNVRKLDQQKRWRSAADEWLREGAASWQRSSSLGKYTVAEQPPDAAAQCSLNCLIDKLFNNCTDCSACCQSEWDHDTGQHQCTTDVLIADTKLVQQMDHGKWPTEDDLCTTMTFDLAFSNSVLALSCLDRLSDVVLLEQSEQSERHYRHIDNTACRELHKIAVIYVGAGQEDKQSILENRHGSARFEEFVAGLGWQVELRSHSGYCGGLPAECCTTYYCTPLLEVVFHVSTRLPYDGEDTTKKMRHIGNDEVHIVWSEHWQDYRRSMIPTEFCDILIAVYPLGDDLYRVQIDCDDADVGEFGPLINDAIVHWSVLACLVRCTAVNANRLKRRGIDGYKSAHQLRLQCIWDMMRSASKTTSLSHLLARLYSPVVASSLFNAAA